MAPEIVGREKYDHKVDCWSIGVVTFVLLTGSIPFDGETKEQVYYSIKTQTPNFKIHELTHVSANAIDFMKKLFGEKSPDKRMDCTEALMHPWMSEEQPTEASEHSHHHLKHVTENLVKFCKLNSFQKMVFSLLASLKIQQEELVDLRDQFLMMDKNKDGSLSREELKEGLS